MSRYYDTPPSVAEVTNYRPIRRFPVFDPFNDARFAPITADWGLPGWLNNFDVRRHGHAERRLDIRRRYGEGTMETEKHLRAYDVKALKEERGFVQLFTRLQDSPKADERECVEEEDDESDHEASDVDARPGRKRKRSKKEKPRWTKRPRLHPAEFEPQQSEVSYKRAKEIFDRGVENALITKLQSSDRQYRKRIRGLEDGDQARQMRPHQQEALGWWLHSVEHEKCFLFIDDIGLGKTFVAVARIQHELLAAKREGRRARFLIVVPSSLINMWIRELGRCEAIKVLKYHSGPEREYSQAMIEEYDVVLTSYDILAIQYMELKQTQQDWNEIQAGYGALIERVEHELWEKKPTPKGRSKKEDVWKLRKVRFSAPIFNVQFTEEILDEAHNIKKVDGWKAWAVGLISAHSRVCMTGTPLQNGYKDMYPLFRFMRLHPFSRRPFFDLCFIKKGATGKEKRAPLKRNRELMFAAVIASVSLRRLKSDDFNGDPMTGLKHSREFIYLVELGAEAQQTQARTIDLWDEGRRIEKIAAARKFASEVRKSGMRPPEDDREDDAVDLFTRIHEAKVNCVHLDLIDAKYSETGDTDLEGLKETRIEAKWLLERDAHQAEDGEGEDINPVNAMAQAAAEESALHERYKGRRRDQEKKREANANREAFRARMSKGGAWQSDKTGVVIGIICDILEEVDNECAAIQDPRARMEHRAHNKLIVFGEYLASLDILEAGINHVVHRGVLRYDGTCSDTQRDQTRAQFEEEGKDFSNPLTKPDDHPILLATVKAAAEGLTLVHARHVLMMSPLWNPYVEDQCIGRAARIGQEGQVTVYRFPVMHSIDNRINAVAKSKRKIISSLLDEEYLRRHVPRLKLWGERDFINTCEQGASGAALRKIILTDPKAATAPTREHQAQR